MSLEHKPDINFSSVHNCILNKKPQQITLIELTPFFLRFFDFIINNFIIFRQIDADIDIMDDKNIVGSGKKLLINEIITIIRC